MKIEFTIKIPTTTDEADLSIRQLSDDIIVLDPGGLPKVGVDKNVLLKALDKSKELYETHVKPTQNTKTEKPADSIAALADNVMLHDFSYGDEK